MIVIDSSLWIEFFLGSQYGELIRVNSLFQTNSFIVPTIIIREVHKKLTEYYNEELANDYCSYFKIGKVVNLDFKLSVFSSKISKQYKLPLADSIIYATTLQNKATLYTMDKHFEELPDVIYYKKVTSNTN